MPYSNPYLKDFTPIFEQILKEKKIPKQQLHLEIIDEEAWEGSIFEPAGVDEVLQQLAEELNYLTVYTDRPGHFLEFSEKIYEENGLMVLFLPKRELKSHLLTGTEKEPLGRKKMSGGERILVLDFEWNGACHFHVMADGKNYIPIYKKPWKIAENLDIAVPFGYNTVIVKSRQNSRKKPVRDRFDEAFYSEG